MLNPILRTVGISLTFAVTLASQAWAHPDVVPNEYVVTLKTPKILSAPTKLEKIDVGGRHYLLRNADPREVRAWTSRPEVQRVEPNAIYRHFATRGPSDSRFTEQWSLANSGSADSEGDAGVQGADIHATEAWNIATGSDKIVVAVVDSGIDYTHPDLIHNIWTKPGSNPPVHGYDTIADVENPMDDQALSHGTHCAGIIGASGNNGLGIAGINWQVKLMGVRFCTDDRGCTLADAIKGIEYAVNNGARVINASWGSSIESETLRDSIASAGQKGVLIVAAAGNEADDDDSSPVYPASYRLDNVVAVAASNNRDELHYLSNFGIATVLIAAPGVNIISTLRKGRYGTLSGTSMAAPHVTGAAALLLSTEPNLTPGQIKERLRASADKLPGFNGHVTSGGRLNLYKLLAGH